MVRYFIRLSYSGKPFAGWQVQPGKTTVQGEISKAVSTILRQEIHIMGAGRTDTGVHAREMFAQFEFETDLGDLEKLAFRINRMLPQEISIFEIFPVSGDVHTRFDATSRTYHYWIHNHKDPFRADWSYHFQQPLNFEAMNEAAKLMLGKKDFSSFSKSKTQTKTNICNLTEAYWTQKEEGWCFVVSADRFLRNMVRAIVGTLLEVGIGKRSVRSIPEMLNERNRSEAGQSVPAHGLYLVKVDYPKEVFALKK